MENNELKTKQVEQALEIIELLESGVEDENYNVRDFDIIDYYEICKLSPARLFELTNKLLEKLCSQEEFDKFSKFALKHGDSPKITIKEIMGIKHSVMVGDKLKEITEEEKLEAIRFITENGFRLSADVYFTAIKRELNGTLYSKESEEDVKKVKTLTK